MKIYFVITLFVIYYYGSFAANDTKHPHGYAVPLYHLNKTNAEEKIYIQSNKFDEILNHPDVKDRKIVVFSILGALRKGKSFFLGYCLRYLYANYESISTKGSFEKKEDWMGDENEPLIGFTWRAGSNATTKGILFWSDVFLHEQNEEKLAIILIDTQGLFEMGSSPQSDTRIFGITTLLSSMQALNLMGVVQEDQLQYLQMATEFTKLVTKKEQKLKIKSSKPFQNLLFLIRDWMDDEVGYGYSGGYKYLETILTAKSDNLAAQSVRENIKKSFDNIHCFTLPHPGKKATKNGFNGAWETIDDDFVDFLKILIESLFAPNNLVKKKIFNEEVTASDFNSYAITYMNAYQSNDLPQIDSLYKLASEKQMIKLIFEMCSFYKDKLNEKIDYDRKNFRAALKDDHELVKDSAVRKFLDTPKMGDDSQEFYFKTILEQEINIIFSKWNISIIENYELYNNKKITAEKARVENERMAKELIEKDKAEIARRERESYESGRSEVMRGTVYKLGKGICNFFTVGMGSCS